MVGSIFVAFVVVGSLVAVYCCTCLRPKQPTQQPIRFSLRSQGETIPMILTTAPPSLRTPSRQSSTATTSSSSAGGGSSVRRFSLGRVDGQCSQQLLVVSSSSSSTPVSVAPSQPLLPPPPPPPYTSQQGMQGSNSLQHPHSHAQLQLHHQSLHPAQSSGFLLPQQYFFPLSQDPFSGNKGFADFGQSWPGACGLLGNRHQRASHLQWCCCRLVLQAWFISQRARLALVGLHLEFKRAVWVLEAAMAGLIVEHEVWLYSNAGMLAGMRQTFKFWIAEHTTLDLGCFKAHTSSIHHIFYALSMWW